MYVPHVSGHKISVKGALGVGGGGEEGLKTYVFQDQGWYGLVSLDGDYLLVYFFLWFDLNNMENKRVQCGGRACAGRKICTGK